MKQLTMILAATMIFLTLGCEKRVGQAKDADRFDEEIDGPTCVLTVSADENLLADQKKISRQAKLDAETPVEAEEKADDGDTGGDTTTPESVPEPAPATLNPSEVAARCMKHSFGDPQLGYTVEGMIRGTVKVWKAATGKAATITKPKVSRRESGWWHITLSVLPAGEAQLDYVFAYSPEDDKIRLLSKPAKDMFEPLMRSD